MTNPLCGAIAAALTATLPLVVLAQAAAPASAPARSASNPATTYRSAFEGYRRFDDRKVQPWRDANDNVGRIGGWQAYARESAGEETAPAPSGDRSQHKPASAPHDAHRGHGGHSMPKKP